VIEFLRCCSISANMYRMFLYKDCSVHERENDEDKRQSCHVFVIVFERNSSCRLLIATSGVFRISVRSGEAP